MRIMATSDLHGNLEGLDPTGADVVVIAGDVAPLRGLTPWHLQEQADWIDERFREWTASYPRVEFVVIPGNHDFFPLARLQQFGDEASWADDFSPNVHFLVGTAAEVAGLRFFGTPWVPIISRTWAFEAEPARLTAEFAIIPAGLDVLIAHSPPRLPKCDVDRSLQTNSPHFGSPELTEAIAQKRPRFVFCGHIHTGRHGAIDFADSRIFNVSRLDERYEIAYPPTIVDV